MDGRKSSDENWLLDGVELQDVKEYKYLEITVTAF